ncbi:MAG: TFIIB-type zinc ribbon-containing protein [Clostridia bacterium]|nr:TFIIB-type zinc ribbon-containing protein [Clostridia bacterium]
MLVTKKCPNCGTEQVGLDLQETNGSFVCSKCEREFVVENEIIKEVLDKNNHTKTNKN